MYANIFPLIYNRLNQWSDSRGKPDPWKNPIDLPESLAIYLEPIYKQLFPSHAGFDTVP